MKKLIFAGILILFMSLLANAQENNAQGNNQQTSIKKEINNYLTKKINSLEELNSKLIDVYGLKNIQFLKIEDGKYIPMKSDEVQKISKVQIDSDVILIFAIIGAVLVGLILLRSL